MDESRSNRSGIRNRGESVGRPDLSFLTSSIPPTPQPDRTSNTVELPGAAAVGPGIVLAAGALQAFMTLELDKAALRFPLGFIAVSSDAVEVARVALQAQQTNIAAFDQFVAGTAIAITDVDKLILPALPPGEVTPRVRALFTTVALHTRLRQHNPSILLTTVADDDLSTTTVHEELATALKTRKGMERLAQHEKDALSLLARDVQEAGAENRRALVLRGTDATLPTPDTLPVDLRRAAARPVVQLRTLTSITNASLKREGRQLPRMMWSFDSILALHNLGLTSVIEHLPRRSMHLTSDTHTALLRQAQSTGQLNPMLKAIKTFAVVLKSERSIPTYERIVAASMQRRGGNGDWAARQEQPDISQASADQRLTASFIAATYRRNDEISQKNRFAIVASIDEEARWLIRLPGLRIETELTPFQALQMSLPEAVLQGSLKAQFALLARRDEQPIVTSARQHIEPTSTAANDPRAPLALWTANAVQDVIGSFPQRVLLVTQKQVQIRMTPEMMRFLDRKRNETVRSFCRRYANRFELTEDRVDGSSSTYGEAVASMLERQAIDDLTTPGTTLIATAQDHIEGSVSTLDFLHQLAGDEGQTFLDEVLTFDNSPRSKQWAARAGGNRIPDGFGTQALEI